MIFRTKDPMNVTVFGAGYVGLVSAAGLAPLDKKVEKLIGALRIATDQMRVGTKILGSAPNSFSRCL